MPQSLTRLPAARTSRYVLLAGLGALIALLVGLGWYAARALDRLSRLEIAVTSRFLGRIACLENSRLLFLKSSESVHDALLKPRNPNSPAQGSEERQALRQAGQQLNRCPQPGESGSEPGLLAPRLADYEAQAEDALRRDWKGSQTARLELLHGRLIPLRDRILTSFDTIISADRAGLLRWTNGRAADVRSEENAVWIVVGTAAALSLAIAMATYSSMAKLQRASDLQYENAVRSSLELERLSERLFHAQEAERRKIAADLHDDFGQRIASLILEMNAAGGDGVSPALRRALETMEGRLRELAKDLQTMSRGLHSAVLDKIGLEAAIRSECDALARRGLSINFLAADVPRRLPDRIALPVYRVFQEAVQNAVKHSGADRLDVSLKAESDQVVLCVRDSGRGFDLRSTAMATGLGMVSMRERLRIAGGAFSISSTPGEGTRVEARVPLPPPAKSANLTAKSDAPHTPDRG